VSFATAGAASAAAPPGNPVQGVSAIDQYVEAIPTASGPKPTGQSKGSPRPLPPHAAAEVREQGGEDTAALVEIATSPTYGAPSRSTLKDAAGVRELRDEVEPQPTALDAVVTPLGEADEPRLLALLALLGGMTLLAFTLAVVRQRQ
jgi:hypothetical protein